MTDQSHSTDRPPGAASGITGSLENERAALEVAVRRDPNNATALRDLGWLYYGLLNRTEDALRLLRKAKCVDESLDYLDIYLGLVLIEADRIDEAEAALRSALITSSYVGLAHAQLGVFYATQDRADEAEEHHLKAIELDPASGYFARLYAKLLEWLERYDEAGRMYRLAWELDPEDARTRELYRDFLDKKSSLGDETEGVGGSA